VSRKGSQYGRFPRSVRSSRRRTPDTRAFARDGGDDAGGCRGHAENRQTRETDGTTGPVAAGRLPATPRHTGPQ
jgi:hypothetical protein